MPVPIVPEHIWSKVSGKAAQSTFPNGPPCIGSGPYQVVQSKSGDFTRLVPNPHYWRGKPHLDELLFITYTNADTMVQDLKSGVIDGAIGVPPAQFKSLGSASITTVPATAWGFTQLSFNCYDSPDSKGNPVLLDPQFRQALQYAVDRDAIASLAFGGYMDPGGHAGASLLRVSLAAAGGSGLHFDPEKTKAMLDAAGYKDVNGDGFRETKQGKPLTLRLLRRPRCRRRRRRQARRRVAQGRRTEDPPGDAGPGRTHLTSCGATTGARSRPTTTSCSTTGRPGDPSPCSDCSRRGRSAPGATPRGPTRPTPGSSTSRAGSSTRRTHRHGPAAPADRLSGFAVRDLRLPAATGGLRQPAGRATWRRRAATRATAATRSPTTRS